MFYFVSRFNFNLDNFESKEEALRHYLEYHVPLAKKLPGLKKYIIGPVKKTLGGPQHDRYAILAFESRDAMRVAYRSETGEDLIEDENRLFEDYHIDLVEGDEIV